MTDRLLVGTRKGLMPLARRGDGWAIARTDFAGIPVSAVLHDRRDAASQDGVLYAALNHGHFGAKLHRSDDGGRSWRELPAPAFPADAAGAPTVSQIWTLGAGGPPPPGRVGSGPPPAGDLPPRPRGGGPGGPRPPGGAAGRPAKGGGGAGGAPP